MQRPLFQKINLTENKSFNVLKVDRPYFIVPWHFHPEIEIMLITSGTGTRFVGDSIEEFNVGDLVMVGSKLVHVWKNSPAHYSPQSKLLAEARVILFREDCFGKDFFSLPEMRPIPDLFAKAARGIKFHGKTKQSVAEKMKIAYERNELDRFYSLIDILHELAKSEEYSLLTSIGYIQRVQQGDLHHLNVILDYLVHHFQQPVKLEDVASLAHMSITAFCRYFKSRTNKTLIQFLNELRIGQAKRMLADSRENITTICYACGYNNVSNFYDHFRKISGMLPSEFRALHRQKSMPR